MDFFPLQLSIPLFERGANGVPTTQYNLLDLAGRLESYEHAISDQLGFESMSLDRLVDLDEALIALNTWLMRATVVSGPEADTLFEGALVTVEANFGQESRSVSLLPMANRITVKATAAAGGGAITVGPINDTASQALYGIKEAVQSFEATDSTDATNKANRILAELKNPAMQRRSSAGIGEPSPGASLRCTFAGWGTMLDWLTTVDADTATAVTTAQVKTLLTAYNAINAFLSSDQTQIVASGVSAPETIPDETTYRKAIESRLLSGNASSQALAWGVYENRIFQVVVSAKATPSTVTYRRYLGDGRIYDVFGNVVPWWRVRPNAIYEVVDFLDVHAVSTAQDAAARSYIARVRFSASRDRMALDLESENGESVDKLLARMR